VPPTPPANRIAVIVVPGVGDHPAGEAVTQVATGLTTDAAGYAWDDDPGSLPVEVPSSDGRRGERHDAERRRLTRGAGTRIDLVEMRWSDLSSFPGTGLRAFVAAAFGLALQFATAGMEATPPSGGRGHRVASRLMNAASWWAAAIIVPITLIAALAGTALWLAVDEPLGVADGMAVAIVLVVGVPAVRMLGRGMDGGGWRFTGWRRVLNAQVMSLLLLAAAIVAGACRIASAGSVEGGLGQTVLAIGGYGVRPAWIAGVLLVSAAIIALAVVHGFGDGATGRARFTSLATTMLSPLLVGILGTILVGGIGAVAFKSAEDATWGTSAPALRCFESPIDWRWSQDCGSRPATWPALADAIPERLARADDLDAAASAARTRAVLGGPAPEAALVAADELEDGATRLRDAASAAEHEVDVAPATWATKVFESAMLPLVPVVIGFLAVMALTGLHQLVVRPLLLRRRGPRPLPAGTRLDGILRGVTGRAGSVAVTVMALAGSAVTVLLWTVANPVDTPGWLPIPDAVTDPPPALWASVSTLILGGLVLARLGPVDPRRYREEVGGWLATLRRILDIPYDVATYLRIDRGDGVRSRVVARYRALLRRIEDGGYTHVVVVAHSQGSMYTLATLFGDPRRQDPVAAWSAWSDTPHRLLSTPVALLTFGCPVRQTYEERLPGQYAWTDADAADLAGRIGDISGPWFNAYRPRDYIGRSVFHAPGGPATTTPGRYLVRDVPVAGAPGAVRVVDACIHGAGSHTGYFGDPHLTAWLDVLLRTVVGGAAPFPPGYTPGPSPAVAA